MKGLNLYRLIFLLSLKLTQILTRTNIWNAGLLLALAFFTWLMARITVAYIPYNTDVGFLRIKQQYIDIDHWRVAFFIHVYASLWVLFAGFTQFSKKLLRYNPRLHRTFGYIYVTDVLLITGPAGLVMGFYANGGLFSRVAFVLLALLWIFFTVMALIRAKQKDFKAHRNYMIRSYALTLSALTLRAWKYGITNTVVLPPMDVYRVVAWLGWVGNLVVAEYLIYRYKRKRLSHKKESPQLL
ncbi:MAG: DUF2306 domain-containing protein [Chitinophagaceae bacterium]|nr:DUF2306 domain-containing protein [Chitinophagaceae bacterium]